MGFSPAAYVADVLDFVGRALQPTALSNPISGGSASFVPTSYGAPSASFQANTRAYQGNEILSAGINLLATSASEPHIMGRRYRRNRREIRNESRYLVAQGIPNRAGRRQVDAILVRNGFWEEVDTHPLVQLLNAPNPSTSRGQFWSQLVVDYYLAGNAYALKARYTDGLLEGSVGELWRVRPDRMRPIPGNMAAGEPFIKAYEYSVDARNKQTIPAADVMHFKTNNPLDPYVGLAPVAVLLPRMSIDYYQSTFLRTFYERGGAGVGAMLNIKGSMTQAMKDETRERFKRMFYGGQYDILVQNAEEATYTPFSLARGLVDAVPKEVNDITESRVAMVLGIPPALLNLLIGSETSSYANQRTSWSVFWYLTMTPLLSSFDDVLNLSLTPEFGGIDEVVFDLSDIPALQEDEDALQERARKNWTVGLAGFHESRVKIGLPPEADIDELFAVPSTATLTPTKALGAPPEPPPAPVSPPQPSPAAVALVIEPEQPLRLNAGRPRIEDDPAARAIHDEAVAMRERYPNLSWEHVAARVGVTDRTLREYRRRFTD